MRDLRHNNFSGEETSQLFFVFSSFAQRACFAIFACVIVGFLGVILAQSYGTAYAATPPAIVTYQGKLLESGASVTTTKSIAFVIYDAATNGNALYTASGTLASVQTISVTPTSGIFSVDLGSSGTNSITSSIFADNAALYLEVRVGGTTLTPRKRLTSVPYAVNSSYLLGYTATTASTSAYIPLSDSNGNLTFSGTPQGTGAASGTIAINPASAVANRTLFGVSVNGSERFRVDAEGDTSINGSLTVTGTSYFIGTSTMANRFIVTGKVADLGNIGSIDPGSSQVGVFVAGGYAYVPGGANDLDIIDISIPSAPTLVGNFDSSIGSGNAVVVAGNYAYLADIGDGLVIVDISKPTVPLRVGSVNPAGVVYDVALSGNYAYVVAGADGLFVIDVSDPKNPRTVGQVDPGGDMRGLAIAGNYAYVADDLNYFYVIDITDPTAPVSVMNYDSGSFGSNVSVLHSYAYFTGGDGLRILDITNPLSPTTTAVIKPGFTAGGVFVAGDYAYFADSGDSLYVVDISSSTAPVLVDSIVVGAGAPAFDVFVSGNYAYLAAGTDGLYVIDVSGARIANSRIGTASISQLEVGATARFLNGAYIQNGLVVGNDGLMVGGDVSLYSNTTTALSTNTLRFSDRVLFKTSATTTASNLFIFDTYNTFSTTASTTYLLSVRNNGRRAFSVASNGDVAASGTLYAASATVGTPGSPGDLAERVDIAIDDTVEAGDVVIVDPSDMDRYRRSNGSYAQAVAGVISTNPTIVVGNGRTQHTAVMAMVGRVPVNVSTENGAIHRGDLLVSASTTGYAMKYDAANDDDGRVVGVVGVALDSFDGNTGKIMALVRTGWVQNRNQTIADIEQQLLALAQASSVSAQNEPRALGVSEAVDGHIVINSDVNMNGYSLINIASLKGKDNSWEVDIHGRFVTNVDTSEGKKPLYAVQSEETEYVFSGTGALVNGEAQIMFATTTRDIIDPAQTMKVQITLTANANGVYVYDKSETGFFVKELNGGTSHATFDWVVIAKRTLEGVPQAEEPQPESVEVESGNNTPSGVSNEDQPIELATSSEEQVLGEHVSVEELSPVQENNAVDVPEEPAGVVPVEAAPQPDAEVSQESTPPVEVPVVSEEVPAQ